MIVVFFYIKSLLVLLIKFVVISSNVLLELNNVLHRFKINHIAWSNDIYVNIVSIISEKTCVKFTNCFRSNWKHNIIILMYYKIGMLYFCLIIFK